MPAIAREPYHDVISRIDQHDRPCAARRDGTRVALAKRVRLR